jgi:heme A synthase
MIKTVRLGLVTAATSVFILASQTLAQRRHRASTPSHPACLRGPRGGGLLDSVADIATGTYYGAADAAVAVVNSLTGGVG